MRARPGAGWHPARLERHAAALASGPDPDTTVRLEALQDELAEIAASRETLRDAARIAKAQSDVRQVFAALDPDALRNS